MRSLVRTQAETSYGELFAALGTARLAPSGLTVLIWELNVRSPTPGHN